MARPYRLTAFQATIFVTASISACVVLNSFAGKGGEERIGSQTPTSQRYFSTYREMGGWGKDFDELPFHAGGAHERMVAMRNVCYSRKRGAFILHLHPGRRRVPVMFTSRGASAELNASCWADLHPQAQAYGDEAGCLRPEIELGPVPSDAIWHDAPVATLHSMRNSDENIGHFLLDQMLHSYILQWAWFGSAHASNMMVYTRTTPDGARWLAQLAKHWYDSKPLDLSGVDSQATQSSQADLTCFPLLLAGGGAVRFHAFRELSGDLMGSHRDWVLKRAGLMGPGGELLPPKEHIVAFYIKDGPQGRARSIAGADTLVPAVQEGVGASFMGTPVRWFHGHLWERSFQQELELLAKATVLITPPGGVAFSALFLRPGASMVLFDWWCTPTATEWPTGPGRSCRFAQEANVWSKFPDRYMRYLPVDQAELPGADTSRWSANGVYRLSATKLAEAVLDALEVADQRIVSALDPEMAFVFDT